MLVAHRGGSGIAPENTLEAFRQAVDRWGADMLELDVHVTRDGVPVVIHDETLDRTTDGTGPVRERTAAQLADLDAGFRFHDPDGTPIYRGRGVRIPTLDAVLETLPGAWVNVECKTPEAAGPVVEVVRRHRAEDRVLIAAEYERWRRGAAGYRGPWGASRHHVLTFRVLCALPGSAGYTPGADVLQVPEKWKGFSIVTPRFIEQAHRKNIPVQVWTVDDPSDMARLLSWGVDGIQTDRPDLLARVLHEQYGRPAPPGLDRAGT
jgi:glycerophosphoryl diester phosphodiesterase